MRLFVPHYFLDMDMKFPCFWTAVVFEEQFLLFSVYGTLYGGVDCRNKYGIS